MEKVVRILAFFLAVGGIVLGLFAFRLLQHSKWAPQQVLIWLPGYLVTVGYVIRAFFNPTVSIRIAIWLSSFLVQGLWLNRGFLDFGPFAVIWWWFATVATALALFIDLQQSRSQST